MKPLQQIEKELREKIIEEVPEIVELKFGCRFKTGETFIATDENGDSHFMDSPDANGDSEVYLVEDYGDDRDGIIGRPISLADVLICTNSRVLLCFGGDEFVMTTNDFHCNSCTWDLTKDLDGQSEEVKRFIHSVICK